MKYILSIAFIFITALSVHAQLQKGLKQIGSSISLSSRNYTNENEIDNYHYDNDNFTFELSPRFAFFLKDNLSLGLEVGYTREVSKGHRVTDIYDIESKIITNSFDFSVFSRFHKSITDKFYVFLQPFASASFGKAHSDEYTDNQQVRSLDIGMSPGLLYMINKNFGLESTFGFIGYNHYSTKAVDNPRTATETSRNNIVLDLSNYTLELGLYYYF